MCSTARPHTPLCTTHQPTTSNNCDPAPSHTHSQHHLTPPYPIAWSRPPPRPSNYRSCNQNQNQNQNRHIGEYTPTTITISVRPPPWPILPSPSPILIIHPSCPPPWPIIPPHTIQMLRNHQNAKHRLKMKSQLLQRKFLIFDSHLHIFY